MFEKDEQLESLLGDHLKRTLDPQRGRSESAFRQHLAAKSRVFRLAAPLSALAACIAVAVALFVHWHKSIAPVVVRGPDVPATREAEPSKVRFDRLISCRNVDEGTVVLENNIPARRVRRQLLEQVIVYDPDRDTTVEMTVPREQIVYVPLQPY